MVSGQRVYFAVLFAPSVIMEALVLLLTTADVKKVILETSASMLKKLGAHQMLQNLSSMMEKIQSSK